MDYANKWAAENNGDVTERYVALGGKLLNVEEDADEVDVVEEKPKRSRKA